MIENLNNLERTHSCGALRKEDAGRRVTLMGWCARRRDFGPLTFIDLRDREGITQIVVNQEKAAAAHAKAKEVRGEFVIAALGEVVLRDEGARNPKLATGDVEVQAAEIRILNDARTLPFQLDASADTLAADSRPGSRKPGGSWRPTSAPPTVAVQPASSTPDDPGNQPVHGRAGLHANRDAQPHQVHARGRSRLHRAFARAAGKVLCPAAVAADLQTDLHDRGAG